MSTLTAEQRAQKAIADPYDPRASVAAAIREAEAERDAMAEMWIRIAREHRDAAIARAEKAEAELAQSTSDRKNLMESLRYTEEKTSILLPALEVLVNKLLEVHQDQRYLGVWTMFQIHGGTYSGPFYTDELSAACEALAKVNRKEGGDELCPHNADSAANTTAQVNVPQVGFNAAPEQSDPAQVAAKPITEEALFQFWKNTSKAPFEEFKASYYAKNNMVKPLCPKCGDANVGEWDSIWTKRPWWKCYACHYVWPAKPVAEIGTHAPMAYETFVLLKQAVEAQCEATAAALKERDESREQLAAVTKEREAWQSAEFKAMRRFLESRLESAQLREQVEKLKAERDGWETVSAQLRTQLTQSQAECAAMREALGATIALLSNYALRSGNSFIEQAIKVASEALTKHSTASTDLLTRLKATISALQLARADYDHAWQNEDIATNLHRIAVLVVIDAALKTEVKP